MNPSTVSLPFEIVPRDRRPSANAGLNILIFLCWLLSAVCINSSNAAAGLGPYEVVKAGTRILAFVLLGTVIVTGQGSRYSAAIWRLTPVGLFAFWAVASTVWSPLKTVSFTHGIEFLMLSMVSMTVAQVCREEMALQRLLFHMVVIICLVCVAVLALNFRLIRAGMRPTMNLQPNNLAAIAASGLIVMAACHLWWNWTWTRVLFWPVVLICGATMYAARSRSAYIAAGIVLLPLFWRIGRKRFTLGIILGAAVLAALWPFSQTVSSLPDSVTAYVMRGQNMDEAFTFSGRTELWALAADSLHDAPVFGYGYYVLGATGQMYVWGAERRQTAHNLYLHVVTGTGLIGFMLFIWALPIALGPVWSALRKRGPSNKIAKLVLAFGIWVAVLGTLELSIGGPIDPMVLTFFILLGLGAGWCPDQGEEEHIHAGPAPA
jgi:O-antigen ligase